MPVPWKFEGLCCLQHVVGLSSPDHGFTQSISFCAGQSGDGMFLKSALFLAILAALALTRPAFPEASAPVRLRINTRHGFENAIGAVRDAGLKLTTDVSVTASSDQDGRPFLTTEQLISDALSVGATILSSSFSNWHYSFDSIWYQKLTGNGLVHVYAFEPRLAQPYNVPPPAAFVTVNKIGGMSRGGIEFGVPTSYMHGKGMSSTPSGVTAQLAGLMACLKFLHPGWNWFDVKAALRSTASNYSTGYNPEKYGYGSIDYQAANAVSDASTLPLYAPAAVVSRRLDNQIRFFINPFKQSRRVTEVLFKFDTDPGIHLKELSQADIILLGGQHVYSNYFSSSNEFTYHSLRDETVYFVWFTVDGQGRYSRIEPYSIIGPARFHPLYGPRISRDR